MDRYRFPKDPELKRKWVKNVSRSGWIPSSSSNLCSLHFERWHFHSEGEEKKRKKLKPEAVPTIFNALPKHLQVDIMVKDQFGSQRQTVTSQRAKKSLQDEEQERAKRLQEEAQEEKARKREMHQKLARERKETRKSFDLVRSFSSNLSSLFPEFSLSLSPTFASMIRIDLEGKDLQDMDTKPVIASSQGCLAVKQAVKSLDLESIDPESLDADPSLLYLSKFEKSNLNGGFDTM